MLRKLALHSILAVSTVMAASIGTPFQAQANWLGFGKWGTCQAPHIHREIVRRWRATEFNVLDVRVKIQDIYDVHERQSTYTPMTEIQMIPRRFCEGRVAMSDGKTRTIWFMIERGQGFAGVAHGAGYNVEYCISGLDPWHIYGAHCRSVR